MVGGIPKSERKNQAVRGTGQEAGGGVMTTLDPKQALARFIELHEKRGQEIDQRPDLQLSMDRGAYDFAVNADDEIREQEQEAERNGVYLEWTFNQNNNDFAYTCRKMTPEEYEEYVEWEREEEQE